MEWLTASSQLTLDGKKATKQRSKDGNVVIGFCSNSILMLDLDLHTEATAKAFVKSYSEFHKLGSVLLLKTSDSNQIDLHGNRLKKYAAIFGKPLIWDEILWHMKECRRLGMIERSFLNLRKFGYITIRVNAKNDKTPPPKVVAFYRLGDITGIVTFLEFRRLCKDLGKRARKRELVKREPLRQRLRSRARKHSSILVQLKKRKRNYPARYLQL